MTGLLLLAALGLPQGAVTLTDQGERVILNNGLVSFAVDKSTATIRDMRLGDSPNLAGKGAYFAVANSGGKDGWDVKNGAFRIVRNTPEIAEVSVKAPIGGCDFDQHYVLRRGDQGFYVFVRMARPKGYPAETFGQVRWSCYLNPSLFDYEIANDAEQGLIPDLTGAEQVQDATYRTRDGKVYTKYNFCDYVEGHFAHGITGSKPGSYGAFVLMGSNEYLGAPTKQYITVHSGPIIHRFLHSGHFLPRGIAHPALPDDWSKLCGPWFIYLNQGDSPTEMWGEAKRRSDLERKRWPYVWMQAPDYPLRRALIKGQIMVNGKAAVNALLDLATPGADWQVQILDYNFGVRTDKQGRFELKNVRPGRYALHIAAPGYTEEFEQADVLVDGSKHNDLGKLRFTSAPEKAVLWEIGYPDRRTTGFRLSDQPRQYGLDAQIPANLRFTIGQSNPAMDWYYAQSKPGDWEIVFDANRKDTGVAELTVGIAGQTNDPQLEVLLNGEPVGTITTKGNSSALYRSAVLSSSYYEVKKVTFPAEKLKAGNNRITLRLSKGSIMYDTIRLAIK